MLKVAICDDNLLFAQQTRCEVDKVLQNCNVEHSTHIFQTGNRLIDAGFFDIVFLDIEMEGLSGLETAEKLRQQKNNCYIVFLTAHSKYVFSAFDVSASHYLLKPLDIHKLASVLLKIIEEIKSEKEQCLTIKSGSEIHRLPFSHIEYIEIFGRKVSVHAVHQGSEDVFTFNGTLEELQQAMPKKFFRCHKSYIINLAKVIKYQKELAFLQGGGQVPIARRKFSEFGKEFLIYLRKNQEE